MNAIKVRPVHTRDRDNIFFSSSNLSCPFDTRKSTWDDSGVGLCCRATSNSRRASARMECLACGGACRATRMTSR